MTRHEPSDEAILAARLQRAYPSLSPYSSASLAQQLRAIERMQRRHAERQCNGDYDRSPNPRHVAVNIELGIAESRAKERITRHVLHWGSELRNCIIANAGRCTPEHEHEIELHGDPRGAVLKVRLPGEAEAVSI